jgi:hypothetical protein
MNATRNLRLVALGAIAAALFIRAGTRLELKSAGGLEPVALDTRRLEMSLGDSIGNAVVDGMVSRPLRGVRLRLPECGNPAFVFPISILSVAQSQLADRAYGFPVYRSTDVYRGQIRDGFSHISRVTSYITARAAALWSGPTISDDLYVRSYVPSDCVVGRDAYVTWAAAVLKLGLSDAPAGDASKTAAAQP